MVSYIGYQNITLENVQVEAGGVKVLTELFLIEDGVQIAEVVVTARSVRTTETALLILKKNSSVMLDGISAAKMRQTGDGNAVDAAKRVTGVSVEGGKYVYIRGLGDRYTKTTLNGVEIPGLDPDKNTLQMDIFPTNLINSIIVSKNFTADQPADFTGGLLNLETKDFPEERLFTVSIGTNFNPDMHFNNNFLSYPGSRTDFLGFDDGHRGLPRFATSPNIPTPISGTTPDEVNRFVKSFDPQLSAVRSKSFIDLNGSMTFANQLSLKKGGGANSPKLGYMMSLSYKSEFRYYDDVVFGEFQRLLDPNAFEMPFATVQQGEIGERSFLGGFLGGLAYKTQNTKIRLTAMHLQNGESRAGKFQIENDGERVGQSGYFATSDNLEYNERGLSNVLLNGYHVLAGRKWEIDWRISPTYSRSSDPDIRKTAFTVFNGMPTFNAGAGGNPSRIWRSLSEINATAKVDILRRYMLNGEEAKLKFGVSQNYKVRDYEILFFDVQFFGAQSPWEANDASLVLRPENIFPSSRNNIYYQSGNPVLNPNEYNSDVMNTGAYLSHESTLFGNVKAIIGLRAERFVQRHTGRDQRYSSGDLVNGRSLDNEIVMNDFNLFPTANFIIGIKETQNIRLGYGRTIARPAFKEQSFAQILDPITNRIFNGSLFTYNQWDGQLVSTDVDNIDLRWESFATTGELYTISAFYKRFSNPIELVRIPEQQTSTEYQPRNVGNGQLFGAELELRKGLGFMGRAFENVDFSGNLTLVHSSIDMTDVEFESRRGYIKTGETLKSTRQMAGQAPYVINSGLSYALPEKGMNAGLFYNVKGTTLFIVGAGLFPDIYTIPFHSLNFTFNKKLGTDNRTSIDLRVSNILNSSLKESYKSFNAADQPFTVFRPGRSISFDITYKL